MKTISIHKKVTADDSVIHVDLKNLVKEGEYDLLVVIQETENQKDRIHIPVTDAPIDPDLTFSRQEMYGDDGR